MKIRPTISIIIPVLNNHANAIALIRYLLETDLKEFAHEVIVVDNGSTNVPLKKYEILKNTRVLFETTLPRSPYRCRNVGIQESQGNYIVLLDSNTWPPQNWARKCLNAAEPKTIVSPNIMFRVSEKSSPSELLDSLININVEESIKMRGYTKTSFLVFCKEVVQDVGEFDANRRSGADVLWTLQAQKQGIRLKYLPTVQAQVAARNWHALIQKQKRVSLGMPAIWIANGNFAKNFVTKALFCFVPLNIHSIAIKLQKTHLKIGIRKKIQIFSIAYVLRLITGVYVMIGIFR